MDVREKLVELVHTIYNDPRMDFRDLWEMNQEADTIADIMLENGVTVQEWISAKDRLPPYNQHVLVYRPNMAVKILVDEYAGYYGDDDDEWNEGWVKYGKDTQNNPLITHWTYLPQPPKGE